LIGFEHVGMPYYITVRQFLADRGIDIDAAHHDFELNIACSTSRGDEQMHGKPNDKDKDTGKDAQGKDTQGQGQINLFLASVQINLAELSDARLLALKFAVERELVGRGGAAAPRHGNQTQEF
jgi:hypothetical protein